MNAALVLMAVVAQMTGDPLATAVRGIAGTVEVSATGPKIRTKGSQSLQWPIAARVSEIGAGAGGSTRYRVAFIGTVAGDFDLRDCLERQDGAPLELGPLNVRILSQLPADHGTDLFSSAQVPPLSASGYRGAMFTLAAAWLGVPVVYLAWRTIRRKPEPAAAPAPPAPSLADQLRPLVESAMAGSLSVADRGRLELLLYLYWRGRRGLSGRQAHVITELRNDAEAGELLRAVEQWLHAERGAPAQAVGSVAALLEPYRSAPQITVTVGEAA